MVIQGGEFKSDTLKPKEVVSLLLDDAEVETKCELCAYRKTITFTVCTLMLCHPCSAGQEDGKKAN